MYPLLYKALRPFWPGGRELRLRQNELERTQWLSREELELFQIEKLKNLIKYAYEYVPYYHKLYVNLDIHPDDIKSLDDFQALPFLTREDINSQLQQFLTLDSNRKVFLGSTGGSTGVPMHFFVEKAFDWWDPALELRGRGWYGVGEGEKIAWVWGAKQDIQNWSWRARLKANINQERYLNAFDMNDEKMQAFAEMLVRWKPAMFRAYASALTLFAKYVKDHSITGIQPEFIETTAEKVTDHQRELLEEVFQCKVADWYSARELGTIAFQCPLGSLHVCETRYIEIVVSNKVVQPGEMGEIVITSLHQYGMPFIRYKIGDFGIFNPNPCACRRGLPVIQEVVGRLQDFLVTSEGSFVHGGYFPHTFRLWPEIARYQVHQSDMNHLDVRLVCYHPCDSNWLTSLHNELENRFGVNMHISIQIVDSIPLTPAGKHRNIISDVKPNFI